MKFASVLCSVSGCPSLNNDHRPPVNFKVTMLVPSLDLKRCPQPHVHLGDLLFGLQINFLLVDSSSSVAAIRVYEDNVSLPDIFAAPRVQGGMPLLPWLLKLRLLGLGRHAEPF